MPHARLPIAVPVLAGLLALGAGCQTLTTGQDLARERERGKSKDEKIAGLEAELEQKKAQIEQAERRGLREKKREEAAQAVLGGDPAHALKLIEAIRDKETIKVKAKEKVKVIDDEGKQVEVEQVVKDPASGLDKEKEVLVDPKIDPLEDAQLLAVTGEALSALGRDDEALAAWKGALEKDPTVRAARRGLGRVLFQRRQYPEALEALRPELTDGWRDGELLSMVGQARYEIGIARKDPDDLEAARLALEAVRLERPNDADLRRWLVQIEYLAGRHAEAIRLLEDMRREYPLDPEYLEMLGRSHLALGDRKKALDFLQLASRLKMPDLDGARLLGDLFEKEGAPGRAADWLKKAARNDPRAASPEERCRIGLLLAGAQRGEEAVEWLSALGERDAPYAEAQAALALLYQEQGKPDLALAACEAARKLRPQDGAVQLIAGRLYLEKKQLPQSTDAFSRASAIPGLAAEGLAGLAEVAYASGDLEGALRSYQKALQARPEEEKLMVAIRELRAELKLRTDAGARARTTREGDKS